MARLFLSNAGHIVCSDAEVLDSEDGVTAGRIQLKRPLRLVPAEGGAVNMKPMFIKEEWINIDRADLGMELDCDDAIDRAYDQAAAEIFSGIIMPAFDDIKKL